MARPSNTDARRKQITAAFANVMAHKGYDGASIAEVAKAARLTAGLVHYHFHDKLEILVEVLAEFGQVHFQSLDSALAAAPGEALAKLDTFIDVHLGTGRNADEKRLACWIAIGAEAVREPRVRAPYEHVLSRLIDTLESIVRAGVRSGSFHVDDPRAVSVAMLATIQGYFGIAGAARPLIPRHSAAPALKAMARGLLGVDPAPVGSPSS